MFKLIFGAALGVAAFAAWQIWSAPIGDLTAQEARVIAAALTDGQGGREAELREPILKKPDNDGWFVCGWVRIGGDDAPLGAQPFAGLISKDGAFSLASLAVTRGEVNALRDVCSYRGLRL